MPLNRKSKVLSVVLGRFTSLLAAMFAFILLHPLLVEEGMRGRWIANLFFFVIALSSLYAVHRKSRPMWVLLLIAGVSLTSDWIAFFTPASVATNVLQSLAHAVLYGAIAVLILMYVLGEGEITFDRICAAVCVYILLGLIWTDLFAAVESLRPGALNIAAGYGDTPSTPILYFSFVTLTSLGYGDIAPVHAFARALSYTEAMIGQLFLAILIGRLVGSFVGRRGFSRHDSDQRQSDLRHSGVRK